MGKFCRNWAEKFISAKSDITSVLIPYESRSSKFYQYKLTAIAKLIIATQVIILLSIEQSNP